MDLRIRLVDGAISHLSETGSNRRRPRPQSERVSSQIFTRSPREVLLNPEF
jgi:hypothetical protein